MVTQQEQQGQAQQQWQAPVVDHQVVIIGTGFAGLAMAHYLDERGITDFVLFEKADRVGGTWRDNH